MSIEYVETAEVAAERPRYSRRMPSEWEDLQDFVHEQISGRDEQDPVSPAGVTAITREVDKLDDEQLEENRYYGLGLVMCNMAQLLRQPEKRKQLVTWSGHKVAEDFLEDYSPISTNGETARLRMGDIGSSAIQLYFHPLAREASRALKPETRLLADILATVSNARQLKQKYPDTKTKARQDASGMAYNYDVTRILKGLPAAESVAANAPAGTVATIRRALAAKRIAAANVGIPIAEVDMTNPIADAGEIEALEIGNLAAIYATLRIDEFPHNPKPGDIDKYLRVDEAGELSFNKELIGKQPDPDPSAIEAGTIVLHKQRLKCPALHVAGMLPLVRGLIPDIITDAQQRVEQAAQLQRERARRIALSARLRASGVHRFSQETTAPTQIYAFRQF